MNRPVPQFLKTLFECLLKVACLFSLILLAACQTLQTTPILDNQEAYSAGDLTFAARQKAVDELAQWKIEGVFSYADSQDGVATGKLLWKKRGAKETIQLIGPIGLGTIKLISTPAESMLISGKQQLVQPGDDIEQLLFKAVGWKLPINELRYWLFGLPAPMSNGLYELDQFNRLEALKQSGWSIRFSTYQPILKSAVSSALQQPKLEQRILEQHPRKVFSEHDKNGISIRLVAKKVTL